MADATAWLTANIHATASDWSTRVQANGGAAPSANTLAAVSNFCGALDAANVTVKMIACCIFAPDNLIAAITPLFKVYGNDPWTNTNFVAADLSVNGLKGNGSNKYLDTGVNPNTVFGGILTEAGLSVYNTLPELVTTSSDIGINNNAGTAYLLLVVSQNLFMCWTNGLGQVVGTPLSLSLGFTSGNRLSATDSKIYTASSTSAFSTAGSINTTAGAMPAANIYCFCKNVYGGAGASNYTSRRQSFAAIHHGLTTAEAQALYNAVQQMRQAMGGGWI